MQIHCGEKPVFLSLSMCGVDSPYKVWHVSRYGVLFTFLRNGEWKDTKLILYKSPRVFRGDIRLVNS